MVDVKLTSVTNGDVFELWVKTGSATANSYTKNFRLYRDYLMLTGKIAGPDCIQYTSRHNIHVAGFASYFRTDIWYNAKT